MNPGDQIGISDGRHHPRQRGLRTLRSPELLSSENSRLFIVDVQEKLLPLIPVAERLVHNCRRLLDGAKILSVPAFGTEQYPQGLGHTTAELASAPGTDA